MFSGLVSFFSGVHFCFECYMAPFTVGGDSAAPEHSRSVEQSLGAGQDLRWVFLGLSFGSPPEPLASSPVQSNCTNPGSASTHREFLSSSRIFSQSTVLIVCSRPAVTFSARCVFLESAYPGIHAQAPCYEQGWVRPRISLRKWAGRRSPVLTLLVFYI